jgi:hypothetical protein
MAQRLRLIAETTLKAQLIHRFQAVKIKIQPKAFVLPTTTPKKSRNMSHFFLVGTFFFVAESPKYNCGRFWTDQVELHERGSLRVTRAQAVALFYRLFQIRA